MNAKPFYLTILTLLLSVNLFSQNANDKAMTSFVPKSKAYDIYYPKTYSLNESEDKIVTITDSISKLNITISSYSLEKELNDEQLIEQLNPFINSYYDKKIERENWNSYKTKFDILVELKVSDKKTNWVWWGIVNNRQLIVLSINKGELITTEEMGLLQFMINNMIINN